ncbi:MAG: hypothetical protein D8M28_00725 [Proteobacteria bacterium]|nr:hypothetical protein [Pseudomonadota bacterium]
MTCTYNGRWANYLMTCLLVLAYLIGGYLIYKFWKPTKKMHTTLGLSVLLLVFVPFVLLPVVNGVVIRPIYEHFENKSSKACAEGYRRWEHGNPTENQRLRSQVEHTEQLQKEKLSREYQRMTSLAAEAHEKCPLKPVLRSDNGRYGGSLYVEPTQGKIPAYPHLSDVYLYVAPPMKKFGDKVVHDNNGTVSVRGESYKPLTEKEIQKYIEQIKRQSPRRAIGLTSSDVLASLQPAALTPVIVEILQSSLAYCTADKDGKPKKIKLVDTPHHENLEQEDALTIIVGAVSHLEIAGFCYPVDYVPTISLRTSQYIPRWKIFPPTYIQQQELHEWSFLAFEEDPYYFPNISVRNYWSLPNLKEFSAETYGQSWFDGSRDRNLSVIYRATKSLRKKLLTDR